MLKIQLVLLITIFAFSLNVTQKEVVACAKKQRGIRYTSGGTSPRTGFDWLSVNKENVDKYIADPYLGHMPTGGFWREFLKGMSKIWKNRINSLKYFFTKFAHL